MSRPGSGITTATFGARLAGLLLDLVLYGALGAVLAAPGATFVYAGVRRCTRVTEHGRHRLHCGPGQLHGGALAIGIVLVVLAVVAIAVLYLAALGRTGQTWGRRIAGVRVVARATGLPLGVGRALLRQLVEMLLSANCVLGYLWMLWDPDHQTWHDKLVDSVVVPV